MNLRASAIAASFTFTALLASPASAQISPHGDFFGPIDEATFGGTGIPNEWIQYSVFDGVTIGLTAHQRYFNPALTNDGAGTFFAESGYDLTHDCAGAGFTCSTWNVGYYISGANAGQYSYNLLFDLNPAAGNLELGNLPSSVFIPAMGYENSENMTFGFLSFFAPPGHGPFDPKIVGTYNFQLEMYRSDVMLGSVGIEVLVDGGASTVPEPASMTLLATGLAGLAAARRKKRAAR